MDLTMLYVVQFKVLIFNIGKCKQEKANLGYTYTLGCKLPSASEKIDFEVTGDDIRDSW